ncbi:gamma-glutamylcyclotransferase [Microbulbifer agarilyticus]|uniref:gamma-glutamylcyclotransferase family protein n=1 Tax=Microbulbifer agarilyticus TaxID=260552 RepID=UPI001C94BD45|nr:gamma-glutamylcyclotransferase family protein [Microbulbifer agarilyticus]MBY6210223.1 gamma-glutamylcyclotransferase [Microbulbifer agarilyticus]
MERLFIYGSLGPGRKNHHVVEVIPGVWEAATTMGRLQHEGWGAELGFPGFVPVQDGEDGEEVQGFLLSSAELSAYWAMLDEFEGSEYERIEITVKTENGEIVTASIYSLRQLNT